MDISKKKVDICTITKKELATMYKVSTSTIRRWCYIIGIDTQGRILSPKQLERFYKEYGIPK